MQRLMTYVFGKKDDDNPRDDNSDSDAYATANEDSPPPSPKKEQPQTFWSGLARGSTAIAQLFMGAGTMNSDGSNRAQFPHGYQGDQRNEHRAENNVNERRADRGDWDRAEHRAPQRVEDRGSHRDYDRPGDRANRRDYDRAPYRPENWAGHRDWDRPGDRANQRDWERPGDRANQRDWDRAEHRAPYRGDDWASHRAPYQRDDRTDYRSYQRPEDRGDYRAEPRTPSRNRLGNRHLQRPWNNYPDPERPNSLWNDHDLLPSTPTPIPKPQQQKNVRQLPRSFQPLATSTPLQNVVNSKAPVPPPPVLNFDETADNEVFNRPRNLMNEFDGPDAPFVFNDNPRSSLSRKRDRQLKPSRTVNNNSVSSNENEKVPEKKMYANVVPTRPEASSSRQLLNVTKSVPDLINTSDPPTYNPLDSQALPSSSSLSGRSDRGRSIVVPVRDHRSSVGSHSPMNQSPPSDLNRTAKRKALATVEPNLPSSSTNPVPIKQRRFDKFNVFDYERKTLIIDNKKVRRHIRKNPFA